MKKQLTKRLISLALVFAILAGFIVPVNAAEKGYNVTWEQVDNSEVTASTLTEAELVGTDGGYAATDVVRVSIVLDTASTIDKGFELQTIAGDIQAQAYRSQLRDQQQSVTRAIEKKLGGKLDVVRNLTLAANLISANVEYGQIEAIEAVPGVSQVLIETLYYPMTEDADDTADPMVAAVNEMIGSYSTWAAGYTGAGMRVAIIDTGTDTDHQSFDAGAYQYSLAYRAGKSGMSVEDYIDSLDLLDADKIAAVADQLNVSIDPEQAYINSKLPYAYNYIDEDYDVTHDIDGVSEHGSHVAGITAANAYIPTGDSYVNAMDAVGVQGVAPDAQIITMKVFGKGGGAYSSDYMAAIEDAIILGCDAVNLSLGSQAAGNTRADTDAYQKIMENLKDSGLVVAIAAGNSGHWASMLSRTGKPYAEDVATDYVSSPASYTNAMAVASVDNAGEIAHYFTLDGWTYGYYEAYSNRKTEFSTMAGTQEYILIDGPGNPEDWEALGDIVKGKVLICVRNGYDSNGKLVTHTQKVINVAAAGGSACIIYDYSPGSFYPVLQNRDTDIPCVTVLMETGEALRDAATPITDDEGNVIGYQGTMEVAADMGLVMSASPYDEMSSFSSWGVPSSLTLKPEITAPGGNILSVNGANTSGTAYEEMSGTSMATPAITGAAALVKQYIEAKGLEAQTGLNARTLAQSLMMSTADPARNGDNNGYYYPVIQQGAGIVDVVGATSAGSYILMNEDATDSWADGKVKAELGDDPGKTGTYSFSFTLNNLTDEAQAYILSADFFMQSVVEQSGVNYMSYDAEPINALATWQVDGTVIAPSGALDGLDFDGSGTVNADDGQALLDYVVGVRSEISAMDKADLDADGDVDSYDAYLFFQELNTSTTVLPANGSLNIQVTIQLTDEAMANYDALYPNGSFVQGYVNVKTAAGADGKVDTDHSIPVLAFYGNWSDPDMFNKGSYAEDMNGSAGLKPYASRSYANTYLVTYADEPGTQYAFGGNPVVYDSTYMPERNAVNSENGDSINWVYFDPIRSVSASRFTVKNLTSGDTYLDRTGGGYDSIYGYYYGWSYVVSAPKQAAMSYSMNGAQEGDVLELTTTLAPEYYVDAEGNVDWDALGEGTAFTTTAVVDNTAPAMLSVAVDVMNNQLLIKASDNQYVAGVGLFTPSGGATLAVTGAKEEIQPGEVAEYVLDLSNVNGDNFLVQVMDYALNKATYRLEIQIGGETPVPGGMVYNYTYGRWYTYYFNGKPNYFNRADDTGWTAATTVEGMVYLTDGKGDLYVMPEADPFYPTRITSLGRKVTDMAYDKTTGELYAVSNGELLNINKFTGSITATYDMPYGTNCTAIAIDDEGVFYTDCIPTFEVHTFDPEVPGSAAYFGDALGVISYSDEFTVGPNTLEYDPNHDLIGYYAYYSLPGRPGDCFGDTAMFEKDGSSWWFDYSAWDQYTVLYFSDLSGANNWVTPEDKITEVRITEDVVTLYKSGVAYLDGSAYPWTATERGLTWTSSNEEVAVVDEHGKVTAISVGTATITATSVDNPEVSDSCVVTVELLDATLKGVATKDGTVSTFTWDLQNEETWTAGVELDTSIGAISLEDASGNLYVQGGAQDNYAMSRIDLATGETLAVSGACGYGAGMSDIADLKLYGTADAPMYMGVVSSWLLGPCDPNSNSFDMGWNLSGYLPYSGGTQFLAVASAGEDPDNSGTELIYCIDDVGAVWGFEYTGSSSISFGYITSDLPVNFSLNQDQPYCSLTVGEGGDLYLSVFSGSSTDVYIMEYDEDAEEYRSTCIASMGEGVWPAALYAVESGETVETASSAAITSQMMDNTLEAQAVTAEMVSGLPGETAAPSSTVEPVEETGTVTVEVTAKDADGNDVAATNGLTTVSYDSSKLTLTGIHVNGDYTAQKSGDGSVTFGYVALNEISAGGTIATLTFQAEGDILADITVETKQVNNSTGGTERFQVDFAHEHTEVRDAVAATCTQEGYTGDTYCTDCGKLIAEGEVIPATGHSYGDWAVTEEPGCTHEGVQTRTCADCGATETASVPATGHSFGEWVVTEEPGCFREGVKTRTCADCGEAETAPIPATDENCPSKAFTDLDTGSWYHEGVDFAIENGLMNGISEDVFAPDGTVSRAQLVVILYRLAGEPSVEGLDNSFTDVTDGQWFADAVIWAAANDIVNGVTDTVFAPDAAISREQIATILYRYSGSQKVEEDHLAAFTDGDTVSAYAVDAMNWAVANGLIVGVTNTQLAPTGTASRAQIATILMRYCALAQ